MLTYNSTRQSATFLNNAHLPNNTTDSLCNSNIEKTNQALEMKLLRLPGQEGQSEKNSPRKPLSTRRFSKDHCGSKLPNSLRKICQKTSQLQALSQKTLTLVQALFILKKIIKSCEFQHQRLGSSYFNIDNWFITDNLQLILKERTDPGNIRTHDQVVLVRDIVQAIFRLSQPKVFQDFYAYYRRSLGKCRCDFKFTLSLIKSYCSCCKIELPKKIVSSNIIESAKDLSRFSTSANNLSKKVQKTPIKKRISILFRNGQSGSNLNPNNSLNGSISRYQPIPDSKKFSEIRPQFSITVKAGSEICESNQSISHNIDGKMSLASTNLKISDGDEPAETSNMYWKPRILNSCQKKQQFSFLPADLTEVESLGSSSDTESQVVMKTQQSSNSNKEDEQQKQNEDRILGMNNWTRKLQGLLKSKQEVHLSIAESPQKDNGKQNLSQSRQVDINFLKGNPNISKSSSLSILVDHVQTPTFCGKSVQFNFKL